MTEPTSTVPRPTSSADSTPNHNPEPAWRRALLDQIVGQLRCVDDVVSASTIDVLARNILAGVVDVVGQADEILAELAQRSATELDTAALVTVTEQRHAIEALQAEHAQLGRDFDELGTQRTLLAIELERARDHAQDLEIKLAGMELRATTAEAAERKLRRDRPACLHGFRCGHSCGFHNDNDEHCHYAYEDGKLCNAEPEKGN